MVFEIQAEANIRDNGLLLDFMYFDFSDDVRYDLVQIGTSTRLTAWLLDFAGCHRIQQSSSYFDIFAGLRWVKLRMTFDFERTTPPIFENQLKATRASWTCWLGPDTTTF
jgi:hypothetical protein